MAKIMGVELKAVKSYPGHEGESCYYGNIYIDGKKVGSFREDSWGGPMQIEFKDHASEEMFDIKINLYFEKYPDDYADDDIFICELLKLKTREDIFKKGIKKGYMGYMYLTFKTDDGYKTKPDESYYICKEEHIQEIIDEEKPTKYWVYKSLDDFVLN